MQAENVCRPTPDLSARTVKHMTATEIYFQPANIKIYRREETPEMRMKSHQDSFAQYEEYGLPPHQKMPGNATLRMISPRINEVDEREQASRAYVLSSLA